MVETALAHSSRGGSITAANRLDVGRMDQRCGGEDENVGCGAMFWERKRQANGDYKQCCDGGDVNVPPRQPFPQPLRDLVHNRTFLKNFRTYQAAFQCASTGLKDRSVPGLSSFTVQGKLYHSLSMSAMPDDNGAERTFLQIYTLDDQAAAAQRGNIFKGLDANHLSSLTQMLSEVNPYVGQFKALANSTTPNARLILQAAPSGPHATVNGQEARTYSLPSASEVAVLILGADDEQQHAREVIVHKATAPPGQGFALQRIPTSNAAFMPLHFMLMCPRGEPGWHSKMYRVSDGGPNAKSRKRLTPKDYATFYLHTRNGNNPDDNPLHCCGRGWQEWVVEGYALEEEHNLAYLRSPECQKKLRRTTFDHVATADANVTGAQLGQRVVLPALFKGGPRYMHARYQDAMALVRKYGRPTYFITFTCNPNWEEIKRELFEGQQAIDRPDLTSRVFNMKLKELLRDVTKGQVLGEVLAHTYVVEYQKRGLPHAHILLIVNPDDVPVTAADIDATISAEIPDKTTNPNLYETVTTSMMHGPCGALNPGCSCMKDGVCSKHYPKKFADVTSTGDGVKVVHRRRQDGREVEVRGGVLDNRSVVPYNPWLCTKYNAHINVELCASVQSVKYLYKYIFKGQDRAMAKLMSDQGTVAFVNEVAQFLDGRYIGACEAAWRTFGFSVGDVQPPVQRLDLHLPGEEPITVEADEQVADRAAAGAPLTKLTGYFEYNRTHPKEQPNSSIVYQQFPEHFTWHPKAGWKPRKTSAFMVGRVYTASIRDPERFHLRVLLNHVKAPTSFEDLRTYEGVTYGTFKEAAAARGLLADDAEWDATLTEAALYAFPHQMRSTFAMILENETVADAGALWQAHKAALCEDYKREARRTHPDADIDTAAVENKGLLAMHRLLEHLNRPLTYYGLPAPDFSAQVAEQEHLIIAQQRNYDRTLMQAVVTSKLESSNQDQLCNFNAVAAAVDDYLTDEAAAVVNNTQRLPRDLATRKAKPRCFFMNGPAGTGKTFVYDALLAYVRGKGHIALASATSGIAALLLPGGATAHNTYKLPVEMLTESSQCNLRLTHPLSPAVQVIAEAALLLIDEAPMMNKHAYGAIDRSLRDITGVDEPFGGKVIVLGGDFRQCLPVVRRGQPAQVIQTCLKRFKLWPEFKVLNLTINERVRRATRNATPELQQRAAAYANYLLRVGDGTEVVHPLSDGTQAEHVRIDSSMVIPQNTTVPDLVRLVYGAGGDDIRAFASTGKDFLYSRTILAPRNVDVDAINDAALELFPAGDGTPSAPAYRVYHSADSVGTENEADATAYPPEVLNAFKLGGMPHHELKLKKGAIIMLLRNLSPRDGLANGTRLIILNLYKNLLEVQVVGGIHDGKVCFIPRITTIACDVDIPIKLQRRQFPVKLAFAMTINKSQGQTLSNVALYLPNPVFAHGQLYTALSRVGDPRHIKILVKGGLRNDGHTYTANVVYRQVIQE